MPLQFSSKKTTNVTDATAVSAPSASKTSLFMRGAKKIGILAMLLTAQTVLHHTDTLEDMHHDSGALLSSTGPAAGVREPPRSGIEEMCFGHGATAAAWQMREGDDDEDDEENKKKHKKANRRSMAAAAAAVAAAVHRAGNSDSDDNQSLGGSQHAALSGTDTRSVGSHNDAAQTGSATPSPSHHLVSNASVASSTVARCLVETSSTPSSGQVTPSAHRGKMMSSASATSLTAAGQQFMRLREALNTKLPRVVPASLAAVVSRTANVTTTAGTMTTGNTENTVLSLIASFLPWRDAARARGASRAMKVAVEGSVVRFFRLPRTNVPAAFLYAPTKFDVDADYNPEEALREKLAAKRQTLGAAAVGGQQRWICEHCGFDNNPHRVVCGSRRCQEPAPHMRNIARLFVGQLRRDGAAPFLHWLLEGVIGEPTHAPLEVLELEAHRDPKTQRGKGCCWAYVRDEQAQRAAAAHHRVFPDVDAEGHEGVWLVAPQDSAALIEEVAQVAYAPGRPSVLSRGALVVELPASGASTATAAATAPAAFSSAASVAAVVDHAGVGIAPRMPLAMTAHARDHLHHAFLPPQHRLPHFHHHNAAPFPAPPSTMLFPPAPHAHMFFAAPPAPEQMVLSPEQQLQNAVDRMNEAIWQAGATAPGTIVSTEAATGARKYRHDPYAQSVAIAAVTAQWQPTIAMLQAAV